MKELDLKQMSNKNLRRLRADLVEVYVSVESHNKYDVDVLIYDVVNEIFSREGERKASLRRARANGAV